MSDPTPPAVSAAMRKAMARDYVLVKRGLYYRPNSMGYTGVLDEAGRYTEAEAKAQTEHCDGITARLASEAPRFSDACWTETRVKTVQGDLARAEAEIARLTGERDDALGAAALNLAQLKNWRRQAEAAEAETACLREAVRCVHDTFARDIAQGYRTKDKDFAVSVLSAALTSQEKTDV